MLAAPNLETSTKLTRLRLHNLRFDDWTFLTALPSLSRLLLTNISTSTRTNRFETAFATLGPQLESLHIAETVGIPSLAVTATLACCTRLQNLSLLATRRPVPLKEQLDEMSRAIPTSVRRLEVGVRVSAIRPLETMTDLWDLEAERDGAAQELVRWCDANGAELVLLSEVPDAQGMWLV